MVASQVSISHALRKRKKNQNVMSAITNSQCHVLLFPFMSKGHTIPVLHFARLLLRRSIAVTIFTTPANRPFIAASLPENPLVSIIDIPFPKNIPGVPPGIESTDKLPSISLFPEFALCTKKMQSDFEYELERLPRVDFMVSDAFLWWTLDSANRLGFPRLGFYGMSTYVSCVVRAAFEDKILSGTQSNSGPIALTRFPWIWITRRDFRELDADPETNCSLYEFNSLLLESVAKSHGMVMNTFYELEPVFIEDYSSCQSEPKGWCVGPLCLADDGPKKPNWILDWLDQKLEQGRSVLYVAFGTQAEISADQIKEIVTGLEKSGLEFLWVIRKGGAELGEGFEERVRGRGIVVREWVNQREILKHQSVQGFLSHCGWNSVLDSLCAGVPILAWPMMVDQPLNAKMVVEEIKVGLRVEESDATSDGFVKWERLEKMVKELMEGEMGKEVRTNVKVIEDMAKKAMEENSGSSWRTLDLLIQEICGCPNKVADVLN